MIITIDGPIATGKSTIARRLAEELGYIYFDTGAMYRGLTWLAIENGIDVDDQQAIENLISEFKFEIKLQMRQKHYWVNKIDVTDAIRGEKVTLLVSKVSANALVRQKLVAMQREFAQNVNAVFEGRDMGSVVFPNASLKIFLTARLEVRAKRRFDELKEKFPEDSTLLTLEATLQDINRRDLYDSTRENSPLRRAEDAIEVDTSNLTIDEVVAHILELKDAKSHQKSQ